MAVDPYTHFPQAVRNLSEQFGIQFHPRGLSLPSGGMIPAATTVDGHEHHPGASIVSPDHAGNLHQIDLYAEPGEARSYVNIVGDGGRGMDDVPEEWADVHPHDWGTQAYEMIGGHESFADDTPAGVLDPRPNRIKFFAEDAVEDEPVHPWIQRYNQKRLNMVNAYTEGGKYLGGQAWDGRSDRNERFLLDPPTGEVVRKLDPEEYTKHEFDW